MALILSGTDGLSDVDGSASTPAIRGTDTNTGIFFPAADTIAFAEGGAEVARFDSSGNLGIGTSSPSTFGKLAIQVAGTTTPTNASNVGPSSINLYAATNGGSTNSTTGIFGWQGGDPGIGSGIGFSRENFTDWGTQIRFYTHPTTTSNIADVTERMRITSSGSLIVGPFDSDVINSRTTVGAGNSRSLFTGWHSATTPINGTLAFNVTSNGNVTNANNSYGSISDIKLKENISDATPKLEKLNQVRVVNYNIKGDTQKQIGVIAQELEEIFPSMVDESPDTDAEGNDLGTTTKAVKYSVFVPMLIKAIQEQQAIITDLKSRIEALEAK
jgi:hypothetical protein